MRHAARMLLGVATALSLLLFTATIFLWLRSATERDYHPGDRFDFEPKPDLAGPLTRISHSLISSRGRLAFGRLRLTELPPKPVPAARAADGPLICGFSDADNLYGQFRAALYDAADPDASAADPNASWLARRGLAAGVRASAAVGSADRYVWLACPHWPIVLVTALLPACAVRSLYRRSRRAARSRKGLCTACGY